MHMWILERRREGLGLDSSFSVSGFCEHGSETMGSTTCGEFPDWL